MYQITAVIFPLPNSLHHCFQCLQQVDLATVTRVFQKSGCCQSITNAQDLHLTDELQFDGFYIPSIRKVNVLEPNIHQGAGGKFIVRNVLKALLASYDIRVVAL